MSARKRLIEKLLKKDEPTTYSSVMRTITNNFPNDTLSFMKAFKQSYLEAVKESIEEPEATALMETLQSFAQIQAKLIKQ